MGIYAAYDSDGKIVGFYDDTIHQIPAQSIEITEEQLQDCVDNPGQRVVDVARKMIVNLPTPSASQLLVDAQTVACNRVDAAAGAARAKYITVVDGQDAVYQMKLEEAKAYQAATNPVATDYPHLNAEAIQTGEAICDVANLVVSTYNQWVQISAKIEGYRRGGNVSINKATDAAGVQAALNTALANLASC